MTPPAVSVAAAGRQKTHQEIQKSWRFALRGNKQNGIRQRKQKRIARTHQINNKDKALTENERIFNFCGAKERFKN
jgi:hypothetical protein